VARTGQRDTYRLSTWLRVGSVVVVPILAVAALVPLRSDRRPANIALVLVLVVLVAVVLGGRWAGAVAGVVVAVSFDLLFTEPYGSLTIARGDDLQTTVLLAAIGLIAGDLVERRWRSQAEAARRRREVEGFERRAELAALGERPGRLITLTARELTDVLDLVDASYRPGPPPVDLAVVTHQGASVPSAADPGRANLAALPVRAHGRDLGHFLLVLPPTGGLRADPDRRHAAVALADQLGMALLRYEHG